MSGESLRGDVYTERRLKLVPLIFSGLVALVCLRGVCRVWKHVHTQSGDVK